MKNKRIAARRFAHKYLILIIILTAIILVVIYTTYVLYLSIGTIIFILYLLARQPKLAYYLSKLIKLIYNPYTSKYKTWSSGAKGEELVAKYLNELREDYLVVHDVKLPGEKGNIDHIVIGNNGIFVIETKTHKGHISCNGDSWKQEKQGKRGTLYEGKIGSPSKQVKRATIVLRQFFEKHFPKLSNVWINGIVVFANNETDIKKINPTVSILKTEELFEFIKTHKGRINISKEDLSDLKQLFNSL